VIPILKFKEAKQMKRTYRLISIFLLFTIIFYTTQGYGESLKLKKAKVTGVIDGCTIKVTIDGKHDTVRLIGVDSLGIIKINESHGKKALEFTKSKLLKKTVYLEVVSRDRSGRLLAYVWLSPPSWKDDNGRDKEIRSKMFNAILILNGFAKPLFSINLKYQVHFKGYQEEAKGKKLGVWKENKKK